MYSIFSAFGIELEYMLVEVDSLRVAPIADQILATAAAMELGQEVPPAIGSVSDLTVGNATWSNELALHVIELKGSQPTTDLSQLTRDLENAISRIQPALEQHGVRLLPTGMHPTMDPILETRLWPHECHEIYQAYHDLFNCHAHGWANVQSVHLNLPFSNDQEFAQLHAATRLVLPLLPALTASSPIMNSQPAAWLDQRMMMVLGHCDKVPFLTGEMVPEPIYDEATYRREIFHGLKTAIAPHDPHGVFDPNFLNSRGAIARFDRGSIEIRVMDVQEAPLADVAVCVATIGVLKALVGEHSAPLEAQQAMPTPPLAQLLRSTSQQGESTKITDQSLLRLFGQSEAAMTATELWRQLIAVGRQYEPMLKQFDDTLERMLDRGTLATTIVKRIAQAEGFMLGLNSTYDRLANCLTERELLL